MLCSLKKKYLEKKKKTLHYHNHFPHLKYIITTLFLKCYQIMHKKKSMTQVALIH